MAAAAASVTTGSAVSFGDSPLSIISSQSVPLGLPLPSPPVDSGEGVPYPSLPESWCLPRIKLLDIVPEEGAASSVYSKAIEDLSNSLSRFSAVTLELNAEDSALVRCTLESAKLYFRTGVQRDRPGNLSMTEKFCGYAPAASAGADMYFYRSGRNLIGKEVEHPPPCMPDLYRCLGRASRAALAAISRHLRLRSDAFYPLLDNLPLQDEDVSSSVLVAVQLRNAMRNKVDESVVGGEGGGLQDEFEKGLLTLIASDSPGLQLRDSSGGWHPADIGLRMGDLLLMTGKSLQYITAGLCRSCCYRVPPSASAGGFGCGSGRTSLTFRLMPRGDATLDASTMLKAGHAVSEAFSPLLASKFLECLSSADDFPVGHKYSGDSKGKNSEPTLRRALSDPLTGSILEDACTALGCGHSFGGGTLEKVIEMQRCSACGAAVDVDHMIPNLALRAAASAYKRDEKRRRMKIASRKRRKEFVLLDERIKRLKGMARGPTKFKRSRRRAADDTNGVPHPFKVNERVLIKGNKRTPEKLVGREAIVTSKCLNGWFLVRLMDSGESVRLQCRSLQRFKLEHNDMGSDVAPPQE